MEYMHAVLLLKKAGKEINEGNVKKILEAAGIKPDESKIKALVASLEGVDIDKVLKEAIVAPTTQVAAEKPAEGKKEEKEEEKKSAEEAAQGLSSLFG